MRRKIWQVVPAIRLEKHLQRLEDEGWTIFQILDGGQGPCVIVVYREEAAEV